MTNSMVAAALQRLTSLEARKSSELGLKMKRTEKFEMKRTQKFELKQIDKSADGCVL